MKRVISGLFFLLLFVPVSYARAELDLEQEVVVIPDTHNEKPYIWNVKVNPAGYDLIMETGAITAGKEHEYAFSISSKKADNVENVHAFIADHDLHIYAHLRPSRTNGIYRFSYTAPQAGKYRLEVVFMASEGWVNLRKDFKIARGGSAMEAGKVPGDEDYRVTVRLFPKRIYSGHVVTIIYDISYKGKPLEELEKLEGFDMQVAAWDEDLKEFLYITPRQNLGGPEAPVSLVFMRAGKHAVFAEFKHKGIIRKVDFVATVYEEPRHDKYSIENLIPAW